MKLKAIQDKVIIKAQEIETQTTGGIIIANASNQGIIKGTVLSIGPGAYDTDKGKFIPTTTGEGNIVLFNIAGATVFEHEKEEYVSITEKEIIAVIT